MKKWQVEKLKISGGLPTVREDVKDDIFLVCASYEPRTVVAAESLSKQYHSKRAVIYINRELLEGPAKEKTRSNLDQLKAVLASHCDAVITAEGSWLDPICQLSSLREALLTGGSGEAGEALITLDTTAFNREALLTATALLRTGFPKSRIRALYVSPRDHGEWLSRGFRCIRNVMGFAGTQSSSRPTILTVLSGFEPDRTLKIIEEHEPAKVLLGVGDPPTAERFLRRNISEQRLILARQDVEEFHFPTDDIKGCQEHLERLLGPYLSDYNVILAPMSTKLSTLAVLLLSLDHPEIQITSCVPGEYNIDDYSTGAESLFIDEIP